MNLFFLVIAFSIAKSQPLTIQWQKCLGGTLDEVGFSIRQTTDGGFLTCGLAISNDGDVAGNHSNQQDGWVVKLDSTGNLIWQRCYGGSSGETFYSIENLSEGGFITIGQANSSDGDLTGIYQPGGIAGIWVINCDSIGGINWQKCFGGSDEEIPNKIIRTFDNGYMITGWTASDDFDAVGLHALPDCPHCRDAFLVKLDSAGNKQWSKCYGSYKGDGGNSIIQTPDSGYIMANIARANGGDVSGWHGGVSYYEDYWIVKINSAGSIQWQKCFGGHNEDIPEDIILTQDGGYIVTGLTASYDYDVVGNHGGADVWIVKLDSAGNMQWQKCLGGSSADYGRRIIQMADILP